MSLMPSQHGCKTYMMLLCQSLLSPCEALLLQPSLRWPLKYLRRRWQMEHLSVVLIPCCGWLHGTLLWSEWKATRAAQKLPDNWEELCKGSFFWIAHGIKEEDIPPKLYVNSDQTQVVYAQGSKLTWAKTGSWQVTVIREDKKQAVTVFVSVSNSGELLPFQAIYPGYSSKTCPATSAKDYDTVKAAGFCCEFSKTKTYWSTQETMHTFVNEILVPYCSKQKIKLGLPESQKLIWQIDIWSVHRSEELRAWMKASHVMSECSGYSNTHSSGHIMKILWLMS
jgi:hypothetical protein